MRYAPPHVPPSAGGTELARCENRTEPLFPNDDEPKTSARWARSPGGPSSGDALPVDQANPNSVDWTLQRISRSRKRVTVLRQKDVRMVKTTLSVKAFRRRTQAAQRSRTAESVQAQVSSRAIARRGEERYGHGSSPTA